MLDSLCTWSSAQKLIICLSIYVGRKRMVNKPSVYPDLFVGNVSIAPGLNARRIYLSRAGFLEWLRKTLDAG